MYLFLVVCGIHVVHFCDGARLPFPQLTAVSSISVLSMGDC